MYVFIDQTFHIVGRIRACTPPGNLLTPPWEEHPPVKNHRHEAFSGKWAKTKRAICLLRK